MRRARESGLGGKSMGARFPWTLAALLVVLVVLSGCPPKRESAFDLARSERKMRDYLSMAEVPADVEVIDINGNGRPDIHVMYLDDGEALSVDRFRWILSAVTVATWEVAGNSRTDLDMVILDIGGKRFQAMVVNLEDCERLDGDIRGRCILDAWSDSPLARFGG